jgi:hypothetical protein
MGVSLDLNPGTTVDVTIGEDRQWNITSYSVQEESTSIDPADSSGAYGQITVEIPDSPKVRRYGGKALALIDGAQGQTVGTVRGRSGNGLRATVVADSRLAQLAVIRRAEPYQGFLSGALRYYFSLCDITAGIVIDESYDSVPVVLPGWDANVYDQIKQMAVAFGFELSLVSSNIVVRPPRGRVAENYRDSSVSWTFDEQQLAQSVEGKWYNTEWREDALVYPPGGWNEDVTVYSVDAGATVEVDLEINASLISVQQPVCVSSVDHPAGAVGR